MIKSRTLWLLLFSAILAMAAVFVANNWLARQQPQVVTKTEVADTEVVMTAALEIPYGQKVENRHLKRIEMPVGLAPEGAVRNAQQIEGMVANANILPGEILMQGRFSEHLAGSTLASLIEPNMRAVTVRVNDVVGVGGFLLPGNRVDVLASRTVNKRTITNTILNDLKVLAVDQTASTNEKDPVIVRAVTLEVSPQQAEDIVKARDEGPIQLSLRNPNDRGVQKKPAVRRVSSSSTVTIIRGTDVQKSKVRL
ncbi:Flp pilus assembly protein CpaB [Aliamphritea spongicola]|uniref:Flp pilus assembly protein CpaB n=1 Tax=Aliamphritea spongicola TaxID=707589 RepID=UPI00196B5355|nr:Flp pilus assembly protein CpaB [Aliamphritea spongicola]MBN3562695.1 Flp pilus assembly protein CpaB [Aliamphritea spongicola]